MNQTDNLCMFMPNYPFSHNENTAFLIV